MTPTTPESYKRYGIDTNGRWSYSDRRSIVRWGDAGWNDSRIEFDRGVLMKTSHLLAVVAIALSTLAISCSNCPCSKWRQADGRVALFDGKTLDGWTVIKCEATVDDGDILIVAGNGLVQTEKKYSDFVLEFDWKALRDNKWDSGVYFRYTSVPEGRPWPARYQANLLQGQEGNVNSLPEARSTGLIEAGQWNHFKLTVRGTTAALEINGTPAWAADGLAEPMTGYIALQAEVPGGGQHRFRNIYLTEL